MLLQGIYNRYMKKKGKLIALIVRDYQDKEGNTRQFKEVQIGFNDVEGVVSFTQFLWGDKFNFERVKNDIKMYDDILVTLNIAVFKGEPRLSLEDIEPDNGQSVDYEEEELEE